MSKRKLINCVGITSAVSMAIIPAIFAVAPVFQVSDTNAATASSYIYATAGVDQAIAFSTTPKVTMSGTQTIGETIFTTGYGNVSLDTNAVGYAIQLSTTDSNLVNQDTLTTSTRNKSIPSIESSQTGTQMLADTSLGSSWGFTKESVSGTQGNSTDLTRTYSPVSGTTTISDMDFYDEDYTGTENFNVGYGVKVSPDLRTGRYTSTVKFTVVGYVPVTDLTTIFDIDTMQQISPKICQNTTTPLVSATEITYVKTTDNTKIPRTTLTDERDGKTYLVSKFADGHCWMSQNLELELNTETALTSELTDLNSKDSWTPRWGTASGETYPEGNAGSYRPRAGQIYLTGAGTVSSTPSTDDGKSEWEKIGYFYDSTSASANSYYGSECNADWGIDQVGDACASPDSICPKGWGLPGLGEYKFTFYPYGESSDYGMNEFIETYSSTINTAEDVFTERLALIPAEAAFVASGRMMGMYETSALLLWSNLTAVGYMSPAGIKLAFGVNNYGLVPVIGYYYVDNNESERFGAAGHSGYPLGWGYYDYDHFYSDYASIRCVARD